MMREHRRHSRPRGYILLYGMLVLAAIISAVFLLASAANSRVQAQRVELQRQAALEAAESALEEARSAVAHGNVKPGASANFNGITVNCATAGNGLQLEAIAPLTVNAAPASLKLPHEAVRVCWTLTASGTDTHSGTAKTWSISEWHVQNETLR